MGKGTHKGGKKRLHNGRGKGKNKKNARYFNQLSGGMVNLYTGQWVAISQARLDHNPRHAAESQAARMQENTIINLISRENRGRYGGGSPHSA